ncbi:hypothetical protein [Aeromicrobium sp. UC242_57]|uniref:hypothetical protein n=1 Tax=Aeromicrobium sp. UC242_57 TaxID=3374624 RepID=UPI00379231C3
MPHGLLEQWEWLLHLRQQGEIGFLPMLGVVGPPPVDVDPGDVAQVRARWLPLERRTRSAGSTAALMPVVDDVDGAITTMELVMEAGLDVVAVVSDRGMRWRSGRC